MKNRISLDNGRTYLTAEEAMPEIIENNLWNVIVNMMDDEIREKLHNELAPCTDQEFMDAYVEAHEAKFNERFEI